MAEDNLSFTTRQFDRLLTPEQIQTCQLYQQQELVEAGEPPGIWTDIPIQVMGCQACQETIVVAKVLDTIRPQVPNKRAIENRCPAVVKYKSSPE